MIFLTDRMGESCTEKGNTKREILDASLELFSVQDFEATSVSQIADGVGIDVLSYLVILVMVPLVMGLTV